MTDRAGVLPHTKTGRAVGGRPTLVLLHFFGSSRREWAIVADALGERFESVAIDLPGFGEAADVTGYSVSAMADAIARTIEATVDRPFVLIGHSMSGKVAMLLAARGTFGKRLVGLGLVSSSPPGPEPLEDDRRREMLGYARDRACAEKYIDANCFIALEGDCRERAIEDFVRVKPAAWHAWLTSGSKEDCRDAIGTLALPTLLVTGHADASLGMKIQHVHTRPHLSDARLVDMARCGHVAMLECPNLLAGALAAFVDSLLPTR